MTSVRENVERVRERIARAALRAGRDPSEIRLAAVTKRHPAEAVLQAAACGVDWIAENRVQEAQGKRENCPGVTVPWCLVGHLQRNKVRKALEVFDAIHTVDSQELAVSMERVLEEGQRTGVPVLLEVNVSGEAAKSGVTPEGVEALGETLLSRCPRLSLEGLLAVGPLTEDPGALRQSFRLLHRLAGDLRRRLGIPLPVLSMGMSDDFEVAVEEGSTLVRLGTLLFGPRRREA